MAKRIAPKDGYSANPRKVHYRRQVWATIRRTLREANVPIATAHALLMPSSEGDEIENALAAGFREKNLHIVDENVAIVARLKRRYPKAKAYGRDIHVALQRIAESGVRLAAANIDLCGGVGHSAIRALMVAECFQAWADVAVCAVTVLRGREEPAMRKIKAGLPGLSWDEFRRIVLLHAARGRTANRVPRRYRARLIRSEVYRSNAGRQTMMWCALEIHSAQHTCGWCLVDFTQTYSRWLADQGIVRKSLEELTSDEKLVAAFEYKWFQHLVYGAPRPFACLSTDAQAQIERFVSDWTAKFSNNDTYEVCVLTEKSSGRVAPEWEFVA